MGVTEFDFELTDPHFWNRISVAIFAKMRAFGGFFCIYFGRFGQFIATVGAKLDRGTCPIFCSGAILSALPRLEGHAIGPRKEAQGQGPPFVLLRIFNSDPDRKGRRAPLQPSLTPCFGGARSYQTPNFGTGQAVLKKSNFRFGNYQFMKICRKRERFTRQRQRNILHKNAAGGIRTCADHISCVSSPTP